MNVANFLETRNSMPFFQNNNDQWTGANSSSQKPLSVHLPLWNNHNEQQNHMLIL